MAKRSKTLAALDDELRERIVDIEKQLRLHISVRIETPIDEEHDLLFCKADKEWQLVVLTDHDETPLGRASRELRSKVFEKNLVDQLLRDGLVQIDEMIEQRKLALARAGEILEACKAAAP